MAERVVVFVDYQNAYMGAREAFHRFGARHWDGQMNPYALGTLLIKQSGRERVLGGVRIYRGMPDPAKDPISFRAFRRQVETWSRSPTVQVITRPLRYPSTWPDARPQEKGIDVSIAVDL